MLLKLRDECGAGWTARLEIMFKDVELSADVMKLYKSTRSGSDDSMELSVNILSMGHWPSYPPVACQLPTSMQATLNSFKNFYVSKHSGRVLNWQHSLDHCVVKATFPSGRKELSVSLFQALVMLLFNDLPPGGQLGYKDIKAATRLEDKELVRNLQSLACGKVRVLTKHPKGKDVNDTDDFSFNHQFKDDHYRLKINQIQLKETTEENKQTTERVFTDRQSHLQLAIVRILKSRKTLKHSELVMEVISQIKDRFKVETAEIKKAIDSLIDRDYMERAEGKRDTYNYVA